MSDRLIGTVLSAVFFASIYGVARLVDHIWGMAGLVALLALMVGLLGGHALGMSAQIKLRLLDTDHLTRRIRDLEADLKLADDHLGDCMVQLGEASELIAKYERQLARVAASPVTGRTQNTVTVQIHVDLWAELTGQES